MTEGYWISPRGVAYDVASAGGRHILFIFMNKELFGFTEEYLKSVYDKYNETLERNPEGNARNEIMLEAIAKGWIRVRFYIRPAYRLQFNVKSLNSKTEKNISNFLLDMMSQNRSIYKVSPHTEIVIFTDTDSFTYDVKNFISGVNSSFSYRKLIKQSTLNRLKYHFDTRCVAIISAYRQTERKINLNGLVSDDSRTDLEIVKPSLDWKERQHRNLVNDIKSLGYSFILLKGFYAEGENIENNNENNNEDNNLTQSFVILNEKEAVIDDVEEDSFLDTRTYSRDKFHEAEKEPNLKIRKEKYAKATKDTFKGTFEKSCFVVGPLFTEGENAYKKFLKDMLFLGKKYMQESILVSNQDGAKLFGTRKYTPAGEKLDFSSEGVYLGEMRPDKVGMYYSLLRKRPFVIM